MKTWITRIVALMLVLACAVTLFGCEEEETSSRRRRSKRSDKEQSEGVVQEMTESPFEEEEKPESATRKPESETAQTRPTGQVEAETEKLEDALPKPGTIQMPAIRMMGYTYDQLRDMDWDSVINDDKSSGLLVAEAEDSVFTFVFDDVDGKPRVLTVDGWTNSGDAYITYDIQLNDTANWLPNQVRDFIGAMDGGLVASCTYEGYAADFLLDGDMDHIDDAVLYCVQLRRD